MSEDYGRNHHCPECDATGGNHYPVCTYEGTGSEGRHSYGRRGGMSTFGAILCVIGGFVGVAVIFTLFGVDVEKVPASVIVILLIIVTSIIGGVVSAFKER